MRLSALLLTKNEIKNIERCLKKLYFCDEIVVIDDFSTDKTQEICEKYGAKVFTRKLNGNFAAQKNYGLSKCRGEWVLSIDSDEVVSNELKNEIKSVINSSSSGVNSYYIKRSDFFMGKWMKYSEFGDKKLLRLAKRKNGKWKRRVHEHWEIKGKSSELENKLLHYPHKKLSDFIENVNLFSNLHAKANHEDGKSSNLFKIIVWPKVKLLNNLFIKRGVFDGERAFVACMIMSFHSFLSWSSLWLIQRKQEFKQ
jgi:glycosyltransferase involved in cell wall biosynthesis